MNDQALILDDEALEDKIAFEGVTYDLDLVPTEHEAGEGEDSDEESIKSVETEVSNSSENQTKTKSGRTIRKPAQFNNTEFETNLMNYYILPDNDKDINDHNYKFLRQLEQQLEEVLTTPSNVSLKIQGSNDGT